MSTEEIKEIISQILNLFKNGWTWAGIIWFIFVLYIKYPENFEKIFSQFLRIFIFSGSYIDKRFIKHDMQWRMNNFIKNMENKIHSFPWSKIDIDFYKKWNDENVTNYLDNWKYFVRVKKSSNPNKNFVNIAMTFISDNLLKDAKKQISEKQKSSIDLFVAKKLFEEEKNEVMDEFVSDFLQPLTDDDKVRNLYDMFIDTDRSWLFFPVFLQEMSFLWKRVFSNPKNKKIKEEVIRLIKFLYEHSNRKRWVNMSNDKFLWDFSKFAFMIVWKSKKVLNGELEAYKSYLWKLMKDWIENIYLIWSERIEDFINQVTPDNFLNKSWYFLFKKEKFPSILKDEDWKLFKTQSRIFISWNFKKS